MAKMWKFSKLIRKQNFQLFIAVAVGKGSYGNFVNEVTAFLRITFAKKMKIVN